MAVSSPAYWRTSASLSVTLALTTRPARTHRQNPSAEPIGGPSEAWVNVGRMARFLELCLDTANPASDIATFWAAVSGGRTTPPTSRGPADVVGDHEQHGISICPVPEPKTVK